MIGMNPMLNDSQKEAFEKAWDLLTEHFDGILLVLDWETVQGDTSGSAHVCYFHGGAIKGVGMAEFAKHQILTNGQTVDE